MPQGGPTSAGKSMIRQSTILGQIEPQLTTLASWRRMIHCLHCLPDKMQKVKWLIPKGLSKASRLSMTGAEAAALVANKGRKGS